MNIIIVVIAVVAVSLAFIAGFKIKQPVVMSFIIAWVLGAVLLLGGLYLMFIPAWRHIAFYALGMGVLAVLAGIACYKWNKKQQLYYTDKLLEFTDKLQGFHH